MGCPWMATHYRRDWAEEPAPGTGAMVVHRSYLDDPRWLFTGTVINECLFNGIVYT